LINEETIRNTVTTLLQNPNDRVKDREDQQKTKKTTNKNHDPVQKWEKRNCTGKRGDDDDDDDDDDIRAPTAPAPPPSRIKTPIFQGHRKSCPECYTTMLAKKNLQQTKSRPRSSRKEHKADDVKKRRERRKAWNPDDLLCDKTQMRTQHKERQKNGRDETAETGYTENPPVLSTVQ